MTISLIKSRLCCSLFSFWEISLENSTEAPASFSFSLLYCWSKFNAVSISGSSLLDTSYESLINLKNRWSLNALATSSLWESIYALRANRFFLNCGWDKDLAINSLISSIYFFAANNFPRYWGLLKNLAIISLNASTLALSFFIFFRSSCRDARPLRFNLIYWSF